MYYRNNQLEQFSKIMTEALDDKGIDRSEKMYLFEPQEERVKAINVFASHYLNLYDAEEDP